MRRTTPLTEEQSRLAGQWYRYMCREYYRRAKYRPSEYDRDVLYDRMIDGLIDAVKYYDPDRAHQCPWFQFMALCVKRAAHRRPGPGIVTEQDLLLEAHMPTAGDQDCVDAIENFNWALHTLTPRRQQMVARLMSGGSTKEVATEFHVTTRNVTSCYRQLLKRFSDRN